MYRWKHVLLAWMMVIAYCCSVVVTAHADNWAELHAYGHRYYELSPSDFLRAQCRVINLGLNSAIAGVMSLNASLGSPYRITWKPDEYSLTVVPGQAVAIKDPTLAFLLSPNVHGDWRRSDAGRQLSGISHDPGGWLKINDWQVTTVFGALTALDPKQFTVKQFQKIPGGVRFELQGSGYTIRSESNGQSAHTISRGKGEWIEGTQYYRPTRNGKLVMMSFVVTNHWDNSPLTSTEHASVTYQWIDGILLPQSIIGTMTVPRASQHIPDIQLNIEFTGCKVTKTSNLTNRLRASPSVQY